MEIVVEGTDRSVAGLLSKEILFCMRQVVVTVENTIDMYHYAL